MYIYICRDSMAVDSTRGHSIPSPYTCTCTYVIMLHCIYDFTSGKSLVADSTYVSQLYKIVHVILLCKQCSVLKQQGGRTSSFIGNMQHVRSLIRRSCPPKVRVWLVWVDFVELFYQRLICTCICAYAVARYVTMVTGMYM